MLTNKLQTYFFKANSLVTAIDYLLTTRKPIEVTSVWNEV